MKCASVFVLLFVGASASELCGCNSASPESQNFVYKVVEQPKVTYISDDAAKNQKFLYNTASGTVNYKEQTEANNEPTQSLRYLP